MAIEDVNFLDMACLLRIGPETVMEKFGGLINTSFFDASTIAGTLKQKDLIEFSNDFPGPNGIKVTQAGKQLLADAEAKSAESFDMLDSSILQQMAGGKRLPLELANSLNIRGRDLAFRLYKLYKQNFLIYDLKNGGVELLLTESGFLKVREIGPNAIQNLASPQAPQNTAMPGPLGKLLMGASHPKEAQAQTQEGEKKGNSRAIWIVLGLIVIVSLALIARKYLFGG